MYSYYVYGHYTDNGDLFYVGKGKGNRVNEPFRNGTHDRVADMLGLNPRVLIDGLSEKEALFLENEFMRNAYERNIILTNISYFDLENKPSDQELIDFISNIVIRNTVAENNTKTIEVLPESLDNLYSKRFGTESLIELSKVRPYQFTDNTEFLNEIQALVIIALFSYALELNSSDIKIDFESLNSILGFDLNEHYDELTNYFEPQVLTFKTDNYFIHKNIINSFFISPKNSIEKYVWINFAEVEFTDCNRSTSEIFVKRLVERFRSDKMIEIYSNQIDRASTQELFDKSNFL